MKSAVSLVIILGGAIISSKDLPKNQNPVRHPPVVNGHILEPYSDGADIYSDGFTQQSGLNPQPKVRAK